MWICPTITAETKEVFSKQLKTASKLAKRIHFDVSDASLAPNKLLSLKSMSWGKQVLADIHVMSTHPHPELLLALKLKPHLVIIHAEADIDLIASARSLRQNDIKAGVALLQKTPLNLIGQYLLEFDHVLVFSGNLGYQGGSTANLNLIEKVKAIKNINREIEIGWDGGVNDTNISSLVASGVGVVNVGGFIQHSKNPAKAYAKLELALNSYKNYAP